MVPSNLGWGSAVFPAMAMFAPALANRFAIALPMPRVPPVISTVLFANVMVTFLVAKLKTEFRANYDAVAKNWVLPRTRVIVKVRWLGVFHEGGKSGNSAL